MFVKRSCKPELFLKDSDSELEEEIDILTDEGSNFANWNMLWVPLLYDHLYENNRLFSRVVMVYFAGVLLGISEIKLLNW